MKHWEEVEILSNLLDRHAAQVMRRDQHDWTVHWLITPYLHLLRTEPLLRAAIREFRQEFVVVARTQKSRLLGIAEATRAAYTNFESLLSRRADVVDQPDTRGPELDDIVLSLGLADALLDLSDVESLSNVLDSLCASSLPSSEDIGSQANATFESLRNQLKQRSLHFERFQEVHPGPALERLEANADLNYQASADLASDADTNASVARIHAWIKDSATWPAAPDTPPQPAIIRIQKDILTLNLALVTWLGRGRSRRATVNRFAARCTSFDRDQLIREIELGRRKPEAILTLAFARYMFDAGFNPLVDASICGLRPDVFDATTDRAVYVEAKQYENVSGNILTTLREDLTQTLNTWARLCKRWRVPEAFLLLFRRSGRPLEIHNAEVSYLGRRLYVVVVDLAGAEESGSRADDHVHVDMADLLPAPHHRR